MIEYYLGIDSDYVIMGLAALTVLLLLIVFINIIQMHKLKKKYKMFMDGKSAKTLEESILSRMDQIDHLISSTQKNESDIQKNMKTTFQKVGLVKYDAFHEMGGKLSFSLALLNEINDGFIVNAMHSREGCYTYIKEIIDGNSIIALADEEQEALDMAMKSKD